MKFEELKKNYLDMDSNERNVFMIQYTERRKTAIEMETVSLTKTTSKKSATRRPKTVSMTKEQMELAKALGLL